ncbi:protein PHOTOSYSTEM I ASSEMBLY 2, chloroplastic [Ipomoea triloba]|uniref:protein PHOTOSYSTEM I ASSEMBLY 2, chloroplastic n=1 Tax=Ipomoea triloba TaxID=35885 RepID=UPI00125D53E0|nr:protein PHOTOSYSTEM I ASSEMBLY 2, chloroplastic [Ipomoea triloba]
MLSSSSSCCRPIISPVSNSNVVENKCPSARRRVALIRHGACVVRASAVESSSNFAQRMERAWLISQQPRPVNCSSCDSNGFVDCKWCSGTGFFILGDNILCQVPSKNTSCVICTGKGSVCCTDCKGTGFRAKWLGDPPISNPPISK